MENIKESGAYLYDETRRIIREAKNDKRLVLFVGAGASIDAGVPSWQKAIDQISAKLPLKGHSNEQDLIKIPQYYYNHHGKKEYTQLMRDIFLFGKPLKTTEIHKKIMKFQADTIITTNYDCLLELAAEENSEVRYVVCKDNDLPYKNSSREIVKMHGDFSNDNFVLKEDDYLNYSRNFRLIETYIKSLIGSKVVLFIGYSLNDPDVKQILSWVKDALKDDFQRAYLILSNSENDEIKREYFKNLGVNIIYTSDLVDGWETKGSLQQVVETLDYLLEDENEKVLDQIYNKLKPLDDLNYVYGSSINNVLYKYGIIINGDEIDLSNYSKSQNEENENIKNLLWAYFSNDDMSSFEISDDDINKLKTIKEVLAKSPYRRLFRRIDNMYASVDLDNNELSDVSELVFSFNYKELSEKTEINASKLSVDTPDLYLQQAYIYAFLNNYYAAYNSLKTASKLYYKDKNYTWYYISEFNRKHIGIICKNSFAIKGDEFERLNMEICAINLEELFETIPDQGNKNAHLGEICDYSIVYSVFYNIFDKSIETANQAKTSYALFAGMPAYEKLRFSVMNYNYYETLNYIMIDSFKENINIYLLYLRSILASVTAENLPELSSANQMRGTANVKQNELTKFDYYVMLRYLKQSDLRKLIKEYEIQSLPSDKEALEYLEQISNSMCDANKYVKMTWFAEDKFWTYLELLSYVDISDKLAAKVLKNVANNYEPITLIMHKDTINRFIKSICNDKYNKNASILSATKKIIDNILGLLVEEKSNWEHSISIINNASYLCKQGKKDYNNIKKVNEVASRENLEYLVQIYTNFGEDAQKLITDLLAGWEFGNSANDYYIYCYAVLARIIVPDKKIENRIYKWIRESYEGEKNNLSGVSFSGQTTYIQMTNMLVDLALNDFVLNSKELFSIVNMVGDEKLQWLLDVEKYDYNKFDCNWLSYCSENLLEFLANNKEVKNHILSNFKKQYERKEVTNRIREIIINYFIDDN